MINEAQNNVGIIFSENENKDSFEISGRGELMLEILLTQMRREGYEMTVSPPKVLYKKDSSGKKLEPIEEVTIDIDEEHSSRIIDSMNRRKAQLIELKIYLYNPLILAWEHEKLIFFYFFQYLLILLIELFVCS